MRSVLTPKALGEIRKAADRVDAELEETGRDGLELAARVATAAYAGVKVRLPANREYRTGYRMALAELAVVLRALRNGEPPSQEAMAGARVAVVEAMEKEFDE